LRPLLAAIPFPNLNPILFRLGPVAVRWYGVAYLAAFLVNYVLLRRMISRGVLRMRRELLDELIGWLAAGVVIGGRAGWWLFYHRGGEGKAESWYEPIAIWHGGMSFHGGLIGVVTVLAVWSFLKGVPFWNLADSIAMITPIGLFFGRIANFINGELVGRPTNLPWGVIFPGYSEPRHPSQLYEAVLEGSLLFLVLWLIGRVRRPKDGRTASLFLVFYGLFRFAVELTREPDPQLGFIAFGWLTMGQLLSAAVMLLGLVLLVTSSSAVHAPSADAVQEHHRLAAQADKAEPINPKAR
jgi:phosphatidylglycerol---prolipoprotein diacylglyceryl transferase